MSARTQRGPRAAGPVKTPWKRRNARQGGGTRAASGDGETFNCDKKHRTTISAEAEFNASSVKLECVFKEDAWSLGVGGALGFELKSQEDDKKLTKTAIQKGRTVYHAIASGDKTELAKELKAWYQGLVADIEKKVKTPKVRWGARHRGELDFKFARAKDNDTGDWHWKTGTLGIGYAHEVAARWMQARWRSKRSTQVA